MPSTVAAPSGGAGGGAPSGGAPSGGSYGGMSQPRGELSAAGSLVDYGFGKKGKYFENESNANYQDEIVSELVEFFKSLNSSSGQSFFSYSR
ncbi:hypothetical protein CGI18_07225 [Vibrio parahaemolyticus]|uniref:hypothetical protein n=1 Tax=Vibrio parahaemolyticus TaxID=670 RepID=UPI00111D9097|nr:hypothetical protein [Vibrio parahaemolyticus]TOK48276.1 hypothetical protein CGI18_07225 [Vibrio parahaemolyticus]